MVEDFSFLFQFSWYSVSYLYIYRHHFLGWEVFFYDFVENIFQLLDLSFVTFFYSSSFSSFSENNNDDNNITTATTTTTTSTTTTTTTTTTT